MIRQDDTSQGDGDINAAGAFAGVRGNGVVLRALRMAAWTWVVGLVMLTAVPAAERPDTGLPHDLEHFVAFLGAGGLLALTHKWSAMRLAAGGIAFALLIELMQIPLSSRHARVLDFVVDAAAVVAGVLAVCGLKLYAIRRRRVTQSAQ
ncbi:hypothetical protein RA307_17685 [Xanthobacteraceae bacterium Astr-EGSB]|uniref:hypothetical protein n=1 Tax=Astrobacterium formosum TaxID=3069710 RepID=UPI0027B38BF0|nr:hypothetical protein [Xanthobacteraceae bacterium Astr-EGSB]